MVRVCVHHCILRARGAPGTHLRMNERGRTSGFRIQGEMEVAARWGEAKGGKPGKSAQLVTENQTDPSREKGVFQDREREPGGKS